MTREELMAQSTASLIRLHNTYAEELNLAPLRQWHTDKGSLVDRCILYQANSSKAKDDKAAETARRVAATKDVASASSIRDAALALLCKVAYYEDKTKKSTAENRVAAEDKMARSVGLPYGLIVDEVRRRFPGAKTSLACLRWYCVKVRVNEHGFGGYTLPQRRPRAGQTQ